MVWLLFIISAAVIVISATQLSRFGDVIAHKTKLGGMFIGVLLLAGATSLPELITSISSAQQGNPNLAAGNLFGSNSLNMMLLAVVDLASQNRRVLRIVALRHALSGSLTIFLMGLAVFFILADFSAQIGWVGLDSIWIILIYIAALYLIEGNNKHLTKKEVELERIIQPVMSLKKGILGYTVAAAVIILITPQLVRLSGEIAVITGLGNTFIGTTLLAFVTSLPELVTTIAAIKIGADDMAVGNLFGSNLFNMFALGFVDLFYIEGRFLHAIDPSFIIVGMLGLLMTGLALIGNLIKIEKWLWFIEIDALILIIVYFLGLWLLYSRSIAA